MTTKKRKGPLTLDFKFVLLDWLRDPQNAADYLTACFEEDEATFLLALKDVADAHERLGPLSKSAKLNREGLYDMLSKNGNPRFSSLAAILDALGMRVEFTPAEKKAA